MIYGDNPQKINEREDKLGLKSYSYIPRITAILQCSNLYVYGINNPNYFKDTSGKDAIAVWNWGVQSFYALSQADGPAVYGDVAGLGLLLTTGIISGAVQIYETIANAIGNTSSLRSEQIDWNVNENTKHHVLEGTKGNHLNGWRKMGFDPKDPKAFGLLLPYLKEVVDKGKEIVRNTHCGKIYEYIYYIEEKGITIWARIYEFANGTRVLSDAAEYTK